MSHVVRRQLAIKDPNLFFQVAGDRIFGRQLGECRAWNNDCIAKFKLDEQTSWEVGIQADGSVVMESMDRTHKLMGLATEYNQAVAARQLQVEDVRITRTFETDDDRIVWECEV